MMHGQPNIKIFSHNPENDNMN